MNAHPGSGGRAAAFPPLNGAELRYEWLYGEELFRRLRERPLAWLPLGILEHHGAHLPWGFDALKAHAVCLRLAERLGGVVLPACHLAGIHGDCREPDDAEFRRRAGAIGDLLYREQTFRLFLHETFDGLANMGFQVIVAYTGHYPAVQTEILMETAEAFTASGMATVIPFWEPLACGGGDHGGRWETSIGLALDAGWVRLEAVRDDESGEPGSYRGERVGELASATFGEEALHGVEGFLSVAVESAFRKHAAGAIANAGSGSDRP